MFLVSFLLFSSAFAIDVYQLDFPKIFAHWAQGQLDEKGYAVVHDSRLRDPMMLSETLKETGTFYPSTGNFSYALGNVKGRTAIAPGIHKIGGAPKQVLVSGHSEASYLNLSPRFLLFSCLQPAEVGGQTPIYNIKQMEDIFLSTHVGRKMYNDVLSEGVVYIRNDVSRDGPLAEAWANIGYPTWQDRFPGKSRDEIIEFLEESGMEAHFDKDDTLHSEWHFGGFRPHPDTGRLIWFNQLYGMNARYWRQHGDKTILSLPHRLRPLDSRIGTLHSNRALSEEEYNIIDDAHFEVQETFDWKEGRVLFVDNFVYQHGRLPYDGERRCVVGWGPSVQFEDEVVLRPKVTAEATFCEEPGDLAKYFPRSTMVTSPTV